MDDSLPLIPDKGGVVCADVRPVLREVFRELDYLPPLAAEKSIRDKRIKDADHTSQVDWIQQFSSECQDFWHQEIELKEEYAKRISREPMPNIYKLHPPQPAKRSHEAAWKNERGILQRKDLRPTIVQNAGRDASLWIKNILNRSSGDLSALQIQGVCKRLPHRIEIPDYDTIQSLSIGEAPVCVTVPPPPVSLPPPLPEYIVCVPPELNFVNFTIGQLHTQALRLVNVSKFEIRVSIHPPHRQELDVEICGPRGLAVSSGAAAELRIHFRARDVRTVRDALLVRMSVGRAQCVPIACYMQPPLLDVLVPHVPVAGVGVIGTGPESECRGTREVLDLGSKLLGDVHKVPLVFYSAADHASFFVLTEEAWFSYNLHELTQRGSLMSGPFTLHPAWWRGGGSVRGAVYCAATSAGLHTAALRLLSSTAVVRPLNLLADALHFHPTHITLVAQEKNYDICSEDDPDCEYYVHLGTAFPHRSLSDTLQIVNHSPVTYTYYWSVRPWGVCSCWQERIFAGDFVAGDGGSENISDDLCEGAKEVRDRGDESSVEEFPGRIAELVRVEPAYGQLAPRSTNVLRVHVPDVSGELGTQRAVLMLILKGVPKESFPSDYDPMIVKTEVVDSEPIPGVQSWVREICEVVCAQMEVWWEVVPVRFMLDPAVLPLTYSRRIKSVSATIRATQLYGSEGARSHWEPAGAAWCPDTVPRLATAHPCPVSVRVPLPALPNHFPAEDTISLVAEGEEWTAQCHVTQRCDTRHPALGPPVVWLGLTPPLTRMTAGLHVHNDTHQHICWWATPWRWWGEYSVRTECERRAPCENCQQRTCSCAILTPMRGALAHQQSKVIKYQSNAPELDGIVVTLIQSRRTGADVAQVPGGAGSEARASLVAYRVLAPRLLMRAMSCVGVNTSQCAGCCLDESALRSKNGTSVLRPKGTLTLRHRSCYRLRITNLTPLNTSVHWEPAIEGEDMVKAIFVPNDFEVQGYKQVDIKVILEARRVCGRRIFVYCGRVACAYRPLYLLIDTAVAGLEVVCEVPIGDGLKTGTTLALRRTQREEYPWDAGKQQPSTPLEIFAEDDRQRAVQTVNICRCHFEMVYIPPVKKPRPPPKGPDDYPPIEIVWEPPELTRVCSCFKHTKPILPEYKEPYCLQFRDVPLRTVRTRTLVLKNVSLLTARWSTAVRNWPRHHIRTLDTDTWASDVQAPGLVLQCSPSAGVLAGKANVRIHVQVYADCWGLYRDQILVKIDNLEPIVLDVWIEVVGPPLHFALKPSESFHDASPVLWMSSSDPERTLLATNTSRSELIVHAYVTTEHEYSQDALPFRLYLRFFDVPPRTCPCLDTLGSDICMFDDVTSAASSSIPEEMDTGMEVYLAPDYGNQDDTHFKVEPQITTVPAGERVEWCVNLQPPIGPEVAPTTRLVLRVQPVDNMGPGWFRREPPAQLVELRQVSREGILRLSQREVRVRLCAVDLPYGDILRVRKYFQVLNVGNGPLDVTVICQPPWQVLQGETHSGCGCVAKHVDRQSELQMYLEPRSSNEVCVEVCVRTSQVWPCAEDSKVQPTSYDTSKTITNMLNFYDEINLLRSMALTLELEYPVLLIEPAILDFGFVTDGDSRKSYFTVTQSSRDVTLELVAEWTGGPGFKLSPIDFSLAPDHSVRIYIQYIARWSGAPTEGYAVVRQRGGAGAWCRARVCVRAVATRDHKCHAHIHDHTDDNTLVARIG